MIIDTVRIIHASSISSDKGLVEMELEGFLPGMKNEYGNRVIFALMFCNSLVIVIGTVTDYEEVKPDPSLPGQDAFSRLSIEGQSISISL